MQIISQHDVVPVDYLTIGKELIKLVPSAKNPGTG